MTEVTTRIDAPQARVFDALSDARSMRYFVTGARNVRRFDPSWPAAGTEVHHSVGIGPLVIRDRTVAVACEEPRRLELRAHAHRIGVFTVVFELEEPDPGQTELRIIEVPISGLACKPLLAPLVASLLKLRNTEMARRLRKLVEQRERQRATEDGRG